MSSFLLEQLNEEQRQAVTAPNNNLLILAGAGSGKTRVLVHRIAWLIYEVGVSPHSIMAVTFTNKAAGEIKQRVEAILNMSIKGLWIGTFHGLSHKFLRQHCEAAKLAKEFQILDSEDQHRLIKRVIKSLSLDDTRWSPREAQWFINKNKDEGIRIKDLSLQGDYYSNTMRDIYEAYEKICKQSDLVDFAELLLRTLDVLNYHEEILNHYRNRFKVILVDEFQDTNVIQYEWIKKISHENNQIMIVGDDDQSIYGWRGAKVENIRKFSEDFKDTAIIRLEQNYRSTNMILKAANSLIVHNVDRLGKKLWSSGKEGEMISFYAAFNEIDEAKFVAEKIMDWVSSGYARKDIAVLYRSNAQSRIMEETLIQAGIPYIVYGGLRFFERAEIKDALAYLRLLVNRNDDAAFERAVNQPNRGIGDRTLSVIRDLSRSYMCSLWQAVERAIEHNVLPNRAVSPLKAFMNLIDTLYEETKLYALDEQINKVLHKSGLWDFYKKQKGEQAQSKVENLEELINAAKLYSVGSFGDQSILQSFLSNAALEAEETQTGGEQDYVQLMTFHSAKGLEFPLVFMVGVEEGIFPHQLSMEDPSKLEEERRLCYVGMTRAKQKLFITYANARRQYGKDVYHKASRFIYEIDQTCLDEIRKHIKIQKTTFSPSSQGRDPLNQIGFKLGQRVKHKKFGQGILLSVEGTGEHARVEIQFDHYGKKWLALSYANLEA